MTKKKTLLIFAAVIVLVAGAFFGFRVFKKSKPLRAVHVERVSLVISTQATGTLEPLNKVEILPPVAGRVDDVLIEEGQTIEKGNTIAWMSSTNRAVLLDLARTKGKRELKSWEKAYQPTPISAPVTGLIIKKMVVPGQTVSQQTVLFEMSDTLIVRAQVDETDIGKIQVGMKADVTIDAFPDQKFSVEVTRIGHKSELVNNVNVYQVELGLRNSDSSDLSKFRAGMTANIDFILTKKEAVLGLPVWAVQGRENEEISLLDSERQPKKIRLGVSNGKFVEVTSDVTEGETLYVESFKFREQDSKTFLFDSRKQPRERGQKGR